MDLPKRHKNHVIETKSEIFLKSKIPYSWVLNPFSIDYGTDFNCEIVIDENVTGMNFTIQLKGKEKEINNDYVNLNLKKSTLKRWNNRLEPTMIVAYVVEENEAYWHWFQEADVNLTLPNNSYKIKISKHNKLSLLDWNLIVEKIKDIFSKKHLLYSLPILNNKNKDAWNLYFEGKYEAALPLLYEIIKDDSKDSIVYEAIAICEFILFNYTKAILNINKALELNKNNSNILSNKASILIEIGSLNNDNNKIDEGIKILEFVLEKEKNKSSNLYYNLGTTYFRRLNYKLAIEFFLKAIQINPNNTDYWNNLGNAYMITGNHDLEMICYDNALKINPNKAETLFSKGSSMFRYLKKVDEGLELMLKSSQLTNRYEIDNPNFFFWIAEAYIYKNDLKNALIWNEKGLIFFSNDFYLLNQSIRLKSKNNY